MDRSEWVTGRALKDGRPAQPSPGADAWETEVSTCSWTFLRKAESVDIGFEKNTLSIRGERERSIRAPEKGEVRVFFAERDWGTFTRSLRFPQHVAGDNISATFDAGVLTIRIPKSEAAKPRKIQIRTASETKQVEG
jgi:HSP20 family protein